MKLGNRWIHAAPRIADCAIFQKLQARCGRITPTDDMVSRCRADAAVYPKSWLQKWTQTQHVCSRSIQLVPMAPQRENIEIDLL